MPSGAGAASQMAYASFIAKHPPPLASAGPQRHKVAPILARAIKTAKHLAFIKKPAVMTRVVRGYFRTAVLRRDTLRSIELAITYACQAKCRKCYAAKLNDGKRRYLTVEQIRGIIDQAMRLGLIHVNLTGGEPSLRKDLLEVVKACRPDRLVVSMVTNTLALSRERMRELKEAGLNTIQISLDSAERRIHDQSRGVPGCYDKALAAAAWAREFGINLCFSTVLSTEPDSNLRAMKSLLELAEQEKAFLLLCDSAAVGGWEGRGEMMMSCAQRNRTLAQLMRHPCARHHNMYNFRIKSGCPAGIEKIYITAHGDVTPM